MSHSSKPSIEYRVQPFDAIPAYVVVSSTRSQGQTTQRGLCWTANEPDAELIRDALAAFAPARPIPDHPHDPASQ